MYELKYHKVKSESREEYSIFKIVDGVTANYCFYLTAKHAQEYENSLATSSYIVGWNSTKWDVEYRAAINYCDYLTISALLKNKRYHEVFEELNKLDNVIMNLYP